MNKKSCILVLIMLLIVAIISITYFKLKKQNKETQEYIPQEEITEEQIKQTMVTLYYVNIETKTLMPETQLLHVKELSQTPYYKLLEMLMSTPKSDKLRSAIPVGTKINNIDLKGDILHINLSKEFIENQTGGIEEQSLSIYSIVNTLTELTEVNGIKILIEGEENISFKNEGIPLKEIFIKTD